jgi:hypothetical protein
VTCEAYRLQESVESCEWHCNRPTRNGSARATESMDLSPCDWVGRGFRDPGVCFTSQAFVLAVLPVVLPIVLPIVLLSFAFLFKLPQRACQRWIAFWRWRPPEELKVFSKSDPFSEDLPPQFTRGQRLRRWPRLLLCKLWRWWRTLYVLLRRFWRQLFTSLRMLRRRLRRPRP